MTDRHTVRELIEDHALEHVPAVDRHTWLDISWNTVGIVTTLIRLFVGAMVTFVAGIKIGLIAGTIVAIIGGFLGWGVGHIAYRSGLASGVMSRFCGIGVNGSVVVSSISRFVAVENLTALAVSFLIYPVLRIYVVKPHYRAAGV